MNFSTCVIHVCVTVYEHSSISAECQNTEKHQTMFKYMYLHPVDEF